MARQKKTANREPDDEVAEAPRCSETGCGAAIATLDAEGWGTCADGHVGQPVPGTFRPAQPDQTDSQKNHGTHPCACTHVGLSHAADGGLCESVDGNGLPCGCEEFVCQLPVVDGAEQGQLIESAPEMHHGRAVIERRVALAGTVPVDKYRPDYKFWWESLKIGQPGAVTMSYRVDGDGYVPVLDKGLIMGLAEIRKLKISGIFLPVSSDPTEGLPLWEQERIELSRYIQQSENRMDEAVNGLLNVTEQLRSGEVEPALERISAILGVLTAPAAPEPAEAPDPGGEQPSALDESLSAAQEA